MKSYRLVSVITPRMIESSGRKVLGTNRPGMKSLGHESSRDEESWGRIVLGRKVLGTNRPHVVRLFVPRDEVLGTKSPDTSKTGGGEGKPPLQPYRRIVTAQSNTPVTKWRTVS